MMTPTSKTLTSFRRLPLLAAMLCAGLAPVAFAEDAASPDPHAGHAMPTTAAPAGGVDPAQAQGLDTESTPHDAHTGRHESHGDDGFLWLRADKFEAMDTADGGAQQWRGSLSWGNSLDRLGLASEGLRLDGRAQERDTQLFVSHAVAPFWNAVAAVRETNGAGPSQGWAGVGLQGLAPYWFETSVMLYAGEGGQAALKLDVDYELLLTNRLILQPALELNAFGREDASRGQVSGMADTRAGLRLRYEVTRQFAPYVGVEWTQAHGETRNLSAVTGERAHDSRAVAGVRFWY